jgi:transcriptional regulator with XRE-family HTH domain
MTKEELKNLRERYKLTQAEFAEKLNVSPNTVSRWELGERAIPPTFDENSINPVIDFKSLFGNNADLDKQIAELTKEGWEIGGERHIIPSNIQSENVSIPNFVYFAQIVVKRKLSKNSAS